LYVGLIIIMIVVLTLIVIFFENTSVAIVAASRLVFAVARDGVLPLSWWIGQVDAAGQPRHAITVMYIFAAALLCTILPSQVAFFSLISAGAVPTIAAYGLIPLLRLTLTPNNFKDSYFFLGRFRKLFYVVAIIFNGLVVAVSRDANRNTLHLRVLASGHVIPVFLPGQCRKFQLRASR
jgi:translation initiation factor 5B